MDWHWGMKYFSVFWDVYIPKNSQQFKIKAASPGGKLKSLLWVLYKQQIIAKLY